MKIKKSAYGESLLKNLSKDLSLLHGAGFGLSNVKRMRQFYAVYPKGEEAPHLLSWSHYMGFLKIDDSRERRF